MNKTKGYIIIFREFGVMATQRSFEIYIDNKLLTRLPMGEAYLVQLTPGKHTIKTGISFSTSETINIDIEAEKTKYIVTGNKNGTKDNIFSFFISLFKMFTRKHFIYLKELNALEVEKQILNTKVDCSSIFKNKINKLPEDITRKIFSNFTFFPKNTNALNYGKITINKVLLQLLIISAIISLVITKGNLKVTGHLIVGDLITIIIIYIFMEPIIFPKKRRKE